MFRRITLAFLILALLMGSFPADAQEDTQHEAFSIADTRAELGGRWKGKLEYRDYQADKWFGIPAMVEVELIDDNATVIRKASFDDGHSGTVYITVVSMLGPDGRTESVGSFRADRPAEMATFSLRIADTKNGIALDATHWTLVAETDGKDDNRPAKIRETTTRDGPKLVTLKEVDYRDDEKEEWVHRNRTIMEKVRN